MDDKPRTVHVVTAPGEGDRVGLWDPTAGPDGEEVFVAGQDTAPVEVKADHPMVTQAIDQKRIVIVDGRTLERRRALAEAAHEHRVAVRQQAMATAQAAAAPDDKALRAAHDRAEKAETAASEAHARVDDLSAKLEGMMARQQAEAEARRAHDEAMAAANNPPAATQQPPPGDQAPRATRGR